MRMPPDRPTSLKNGLVELRQHTLAQYSDVSSVLALMDMYELHYEAEACYLASQNGKRQLKVAEPCRRASDGDAASERQRPLVEVELALEHDASTLSLAVTSDAPDGCDDQSFGVSEIKMEYFGDGACDPTAAPTVSAASGYAR